MDTEILRNLANNAERRALILYGHYENTSSAEAKAAYLNDYFYWIGHANAYKGIIGMVELATVVEDELDAEQRCP